MQFENEERIDGAQLTIRINNAQHTRGEEEMAAMAMRRTFSDSWTFVDRELARLDDAAVLLRLVKSDKILENGVHHSVLYPSHSSGRLPTSRTPLLQQLPPRDQTAARRESTSRSRTRSVQQHGQLDGG